MVLLSEVMQSVQQNGATIRRWVTVMVLFSLCLIMYIMLGNMGLPAHLQPNSSKWMPYKYHKFKDKTWFERTCIQSRTPGVFEDLEIVISEWKETKDKDCRSLYFNFLKLIRVTFQEGEVIIPDSFSFKVKSWLGNNEKLFQEAHKQKIISLFNLYTREHNVYNPIRSKRPLSLPKIPERQYIDQLAAETEPSCDFCKHSQFTAEDPAGRIESVHAYSASNTFKLDRWHALFMLKTHHPLNWTREQFVDLMDVGQKWFSQVHKKEPKYKYPSMVWDLMPHAGASQVHPHVHGFIDKDAYQGAMEMWKQAAIEYNEDFPNRNYFTDIIELHSILGLTATYGKAIAFANLVPKRDNEIVIVSEKADEDFFLLWYFVIRGFLDDMGSGNLCFSSGVAFPSMTGDLSANSLPAYIRILTRGPVADVRADVSSLELFTASNANTDPYKVIEVMRQSVDKRSSLHR